MKPFFDAYIQGDTAVRKLFSAAPEQVFSLPDRAPAWPGGMAEAITGGQHITGAAGEPLTGREWVIATGQQPGLFTGPLYTIYKAVTAVNIAREIGAAGIPCIPLFWNAADDHDFEEVRSAHFLTRRHEILSLQYTPRGGTAALALDISDLPMYRVPVEPSLHGLIDTAAEACAGSEQRDQIRDLLHDTLQQAHSVAEWFSLLMAQLFSNTSLRLFAPHTRAARLTAIPVLRREIMHPLASTALLREQGLRIAALGHTPPIQRDDDACNFFLEVDGRRRKVLYQKQRFVIPEDSLSYDAGEMLELLEIAPERFSPNVALRPVVQQHLFPVAAYVAGPGEVAYWAQLKTIFDHFETSMPIVYPRISCTLHSVKTRRFMQRYGLENNDLTGDNDILARALALEGDNPAVKALGHMRPGFVQTLDALVQEIENASAKPAFAHAAKQFKQKTLSALDNLERQFLHADTQQRQAVEARIKRLRNTVAPLNRPQERVLSIFSFLFEHGLPLIQQMMDSLDAKKFTPQEMEL